MESYPDWPAPGFGGASIYDSTNLWPISSSRLSPIASSRTDLDGPADFGSTFGSGSLNGIQLDEDVPCHYRSLPTNLFGRSFDEAAADLFALLRPQKTPRSITPSLMSDSDSPQPSSPSIASPMSFTHNLSRDASPPTSPTTKIRQQTILEVEEDSLVTATQAMGIRSSPRISFTSVESPEEPPAIHIDAPSPPPQGTLNSDNIPEQLPHMLGPRSSLQQLLEAAESLGALRSDPPRLLAPPPSSVKKGKRQPSKPKEPEQQDQAEQLPPMPKSDIKDPTPVLEPRHGRQPKQAKSGVVSTCPQCTKTFTRRFDLQRHIASVHETQSTAVTLKRTCPVCYETLSRKDAFRRHYLKVPASCNRLSKLLGKAPPPEREESLYKLCREGKPPLPDQVPLPGRPSA